jgi:hypothetical protein
MRSPSCSTGKLTGDVEVDETFIGAKARNMHKSKRARLVKGSGPFGSSKAAFHASSSAARRESVRSS